MYNILPALLLTNKTYHRYTYVCLLLLSLYLISISLLFSHDHFYVLSTTSGGVIFFIFFVVNKNWVSYCLNYCLYVVAFFGRSINSCTQIRYKTHKTKNERKNFNYVLKSLQYVLRTWYQHYLNDFLFHWSGIELSELSEVSECMYVQS